MPSNLGTKRAARQPAQASPAAGSGLHRFVAMQDFAICWNGCTLNYHARTRYSVEAPLKAALSATDRDIVWES